MKVNEFKLIIKERWKFYLSGYVIGYLLPLIMEGAPSWHYYFPIRVFAIAMAIGLGQAFYYSTKQLTVFESVLKGIKPVMLMIILFSATAISKSLILGLTGYDIMPLIGF